MIDYKKLLQEFKESGLSLTNFSKKVNHDRGTLGKRFKELGYDCSIKDKKFNEHIFDTIDTEEKAYWLGFLFADGYVSKNKYLVEVDLKGSDINHLIKLNNFIGYETNHVTVSESKCNNKKFPRCRLWMCSRHLWKTLNDYGCTPQKSLTLKFPDISIFESKDLILPFIRGYFDRDGYFSYMLYKRSEVSIVKPLIGFIGTKEFLDKIIEYLDLTKNNRCKDKRRPDSNTFSIRITKNDYLNIIDRLYENSKIYLDRKYKMYLFFKDNYCRLLEDFNKEFPDKLSRSRKDNTQI